MGTRARNVVWVLGAGFSKPLGGPLLDDLMKPHRLQRLKNPHWEEKPGGWDHHWQRWSHLLNIFHQLDKAYDAEQFIELLQSAATTEGGQARAILSSIGGNPSWAELARDATNYLGVMMHEFVASTDISLESWKPYRRWAGEFQPMDTIVSFNYDLVVDRAMGSRDPQLNPISHQRLHGHILEVFVEHPTGKRLETLKRPTQRLFDSKVEFAIGVPGPGKMYVSMTEFQPRWDDAKAALKKADAVVFVGFRFPPTDSHALSELLGAIRDNEQPHVELHIVLGPTNTPDIERLSSLLRWSCQAQKYECFGDARDGDLPTDAATFGISWQPLWAQDFMTVFTRDGLFGW